MVYICFSYVSYNFIINSIILFDSLGIVLFVVFVLWMDMWLDVIVVILWWINLIGFLLNLIKVVNIKLFEFFVVLYCNYSLFVFNK